VAGEPIYNFAPPEGARVVTVTRALVEGNPIEPVAQEWLEQSIAQWREREEKYPRWYFMADNDSIRLVGIPTHDIVRGLEVDVALKPSITAKVCEDFLFENWHKTIVAGALSELLRIPGQPWSKPSSANEFLQQFRKGVSKARSREMKSGLKVSRTAQPKRFGG
jgi:hypothetical protein